MTTAQIAPLVGAAALLLAGCSSCSRGDGEDVDTFEEFDGGPTTPCANAPLADEVCVSGGRFLMGCMEQDAACEEIEKPVHVVQLSPFFVDRDETTWVPFIEFLNTLREGYVRQWDRVLVDSPGQEVVWRNPLWGGGCCLKYPIHLAESGDYEWGTPDPDGSFDMYAEYPDAWASLVSPSASVAAVGKVGARLYCESLGKRLPTEAEWEYAARGQAKTIYPGQCGDELHCNWAGYGVCGGAGCDDCYTDGECAPLEDMHQNWCVSPWGAVRMAGNAIEWVEDEFVGDYSACADGCVDPAPTQGGPAIAKGGAIVSNDESFLRISKRSVFEGQADWSAFGGVRCARDDAPYQPPGADGGADGGE